MCIFVYAVQAIIYLRRPFENVYTQYERVLRRKRVRTKFSSNLNYCFIKTVPLRNSIALRADNVNKGPCYGTTVDLKRIRNELRTDTAEKSVRRFQLG